MKWVEATKENYHALKALGFTFEMSMCDIFDDIALYHYSDVFEIEIEKGNVLWSSANERFNEDNKYRIDLIDTDLPNILYFNKKYNTDFLLIKMEFIKIKSGCGYYAKFDGDCSEIRCIDIERFKEKLNIDYFLTKNVLQYTVL